MPMTDRPSAGDLAANGQGPADFGVGIEDIDKTTWAQTWDSLNDFGRGVEGHWKEHVEPAIEDLGPVLEKGLEATAYTAHTVGVVLVTATHEAVDHTMSAMRPAIESSSKAIDEHVMPPLQAFGKDVERSTKQGLRAVGPALAAAATSTAHAIGPALGTSARTIERAGSATMEGLEKGVEKSASATVAAWQKVSEQMAKVRKAVDESDIGRLTDAELEKAWADFKKFIQLDWGNLQDDNLPQLPPVGDRCPLLGSRQFVTDMARLSEQLVMDDLTPDYFPDCVEVELGPTAEQQPNWRAHELQQPNGQTHSPYKLATPAKKPSPPSVAGQSATGAKSGHGDQLSPEILPAPGSTGSSSSSSSSSRRGPVEHPVNPVTASTSPISSTTLGTRLLRASPICLLSTCRHRAAPRSGELKSSAREHTAVNRLPSSRVTASVRSPGETITTTRSFATLGSGGQRWRWNCTGDTSPKYLHGSTLKLGSRSRRRFCASNPTARIPSLSSSSAEARKPWTTLYPTPLSSSPPYPSRRFLCPLLSLNGTETTAARDGTCRTAPMASGERTRRTRLSEDAKAWPIHEAEGVTERRRGGRCIP